MSLAQGKPLIVALALSAAMGMASSGWAQSQQDQSSAGRPATSAAPATDVRPIPPSRAEMSDSAFKKLDAAGKGYVSPDDTRGLDVIKYTGPLADRRPVEPPDVRPAGPATPLRDLVAPRLRVRAVRARRGRVVVTVRCNEDCYGRLGGRAFALRAGVTKRFVLRGARRRVRVAVVDRAGNKAVVRARVRR